MLTFIRDGVKDKNLNPIFLKRLDMNSEFFMKEILMEYKEKSHPISSIEIETINRCNNDCSFCPVNRKSDTRPYHKMTDVMFYNIINQLEEMNYKGLINYFSNNEPLVDSRICDFIEYGHKKLPFATHALITNGLVLTNEMFDRLTKHLDRLLIDNYNDDMELYPNIKNAIELYSNDDTECQVTVSYRKKNQVLDTRGGSAPNRINDTTFVSCCMLPFTQMIIRPDGKVSRCCQDALGNTTLGDLNVNTIDEIWNGKAYKALRNTMLTNGRGKLDYCKNCDIFGVINSCNVDWGSKMSYALVKLLWDKIKIENRKICIFGNDKENYKLIRLLSSHNIKIDDIITDINDYRNYDDKFYILFTHPIEDSMDKFDPDLKRIGKDYVICEQLLSLISNINYDLTRDYIDQIRRFYCSVNNKKIYVFGTGKSTENILSILSTIEIEAFIDNNNKKWNTQYKGREVLSPNELKKEDIKNIVVIIASIYFDEIKEQLISNELCMDENVFDCRKLFDNMRGYDSILYPKNPIS